MSKSDLPGTMDRIKGTGLDGIESILLTDGFFKTLHDPDEFAAVMGFASGFENHAQIHNQVMNRWYGRDPASAREWAIALGNPDDQKMACDEIFQCWAPGDLQGAKK